MISFNFQIEEDASSTVLNWGIWVVLIASYFTMKLLSFAYKKPYLRIENCIVKPHCVPQLEALLGKSASDDDERDALEHFEAVGLLEPHRVHGP